MKKNLPYIAIIALTLILTFMLAKYFPELPIVSDSEDYHTIAASIISNGIYPSIPNQTLLIYPPLYPLFVTVVYMFTHVGSYASVYSIQYLLVGTMSILVFLILRRFSKVPFLFSLIASLCVLFWPYFVLYSQLISSEVLYSLLLIVFFFLFFSIKKESGWLPVWLSGAALGLTILTRPVALLLLPWIIIGLWITSKAPKAFGSHNIPWNKYLMVLLISIALLVPWTAYVHKKYDRIIPVASNLGNVFSKANKTFEYLSDTKKPSILKAKMKNLYLFWDPGASGYHLDILKDKYPIAGIAVGVYKIIFFVILGLAAIGAYIHRNNRLVLYSLMIITYTWAIHVTLFPFPRYTLPIIPFVIIVAAVGATYTYERFRKTN